MSESCLKRSTRLRPLSFVYPPAGECHNQNWAKITKTRPASSPILHQHDAFMDHGDQADYKWLSMHFANARFVLNLRRLKPWLVSRVDHVRRSRVAAGCSPYGGRDCKTSSTDFLDNSDAQILRWVVKQAKHQNRVLHFFNSSWTLRQRFAVIDVEAMSTSGLNLVLNWVSRPSLSTHTTKVAVLTPNDVPMDAAKHHMVPPDANSNKHADRTREKVEEVLLQHGCTATMWSSSWYGQCATAISRMALAGAGSSAAKVARL